MQNVVSYPDNKNVRFAWPALLVYPVGVYQLWKNSTKLWLKLLYTIIGLPLFLAGLIFLSIVCFGAFLPPLDLSIGNRPDRTLYNPNGNYATTFLKTGRETNGAYELVRVELEPKGGNEWHYHKTFDEHFKVESGTVKIGLEGQEILLEQGENTKALKGQMHFFFNPSEKPAVLMVKTVPARGLEKTIRIGYGLGNDGLTDETGIPKNFWHLVLLLGYSESYLEGLPGFIQEPLIKNMARIAQWKGEDKALEKYFK